MNNQIKYFKLSLKPCHWYTCCKSSKKPFCDGSHKGTSFTPMEFTLINIEHTKIFNNIKFIAFDLS